MGSKVLISIVLAGTFIISFFLATFLFDEFAKQVGFYDEGLRDMGEFNYAIR